MTNIIIGAIVGFILGFTYTIVSTSAHYSDLMARYKKYGGPQPHLNIKVSLFGAFSTGMLGLVVAGVIGLIVYLV